MTTAALTIWASKTIKRRIVLQVLYAPEGRWRAEAIDENGSTVGMEFSDNPEQAVQNLTSRWGMKRDPYVLVRCGANGTQIAILLNRRNESVQLIKFRAKPKKWAKARWYPADVVIGNVSPDNPRRRRAEQVPL
jgi:hypothetical protein